MRDFCAQVEFVTWLLLLNWIELNNDTVDLLHNWLTLHSDWTESTWLVFDEVCVVDSSLLLLWNNISCLVLVICRGRGMKFRGRGGRMGRGIRGGRGMMMMMKGFRPPGHMRGRGRDGFTNGFGPMRSCRSALSSWRIILMNSFKKSCFSLCFAGEAWVGRGHILTCVAVEVEAVRWEWAWVRRRRLLHPCTWEDLLHTCTGVCTTPSNIGAIKVFFYILHSTNYVLFLRHRFLDFNLHFCFYLMREQYIIKTNNI